MENYVITISRRFASNGHAIAGQVGRELNIPVYDRSAVEARVSSIVFSKNSVDSGKEDTNLSPEDEKSRKNLLYGIFHREAKEDVIDQAQIEFDRQSSVIKELASESSCIILGRCADQIFREHTRALHVFIYAPDEERIRHAMQMLNTGENEARSLILTEDRAREAYRKRFCVGSQDELIGRHISLDSSRFGVDESAKIIIHAAKYLFYESDLQI